MEIAPGTTDVTRYVMLTDSTAFTPEGDYTITDLWLTYVRNRALAVRTAATELAAADSVHSDNKAIQVNKATALGLYRIDWPDACWATGSDKVMLMVAGAGLAPVVETITISSVADSDADAIADAVWDEATSGHTTTGTYGVAVPVNVSPLSSVVATDPIAASQDVTLYQHAQKPDIQWTITDTDGNAVDLSAKTVRLQVYHPDTLAVLFTRETGGSGITISGAGNNIVTCTYTDTHTANALTRQYRLWNTTDDQVLAKGAFVILETVRDPAA